MNFVNENYLYLLLFLPLLMYIFIVRIKKSHKILRQHIDARCLHVITGSLFRGRQVEKQFFFFLAILCLIIALARPHGKKISKEVPTKATEVILLADVSRSMLVEDMNGFSRLSVMKKQLDQLIGLLSGQKVSLISFAGSAELFSPLTLDHSILKLYVSSLITSTHIQGTDFGSAFRMALRALKEGGASPSDVDSITKVIVVASDGEDNEGMAFESAERSLGENVRIITLGFGTKKGGVIPIYNQKGDKIGYKKDNNGQLILSRFNESTLKEISRISKGSFYQVSVGGKSFQKVYSDIESLREGALVYTSQTFYEEWYQYPLLLALFFGSLCFFIGERKGYKSLAWHSYLEKQ